MSLPPSKTPHPHAITLATRITICRLAAIPVFILLVLYYLASIRNGAPCHTYRYAAAAVFFLIALTDALDGYLARTRNEVTRLGSILDPIADKALLMSAVILLTRPSLPDLHPQFPVWFTLLVISRDVFLITGAFLLNSLTGHVEIQPHASGKAATLVLMAATLTALLQLPDPLFLTLVLTSTVLTAVSGILYTRDGLSQLKASHHPKD